MITFVRSATAQPGKFLEYLELVQKAVAIANRVGRAELKVATSFGGNPQRVAVIGEFESVAEFAEKAGALTADPGWREAATKAQALTVPQSAHDDIWAHV